MAFARRAIEKDATWSRGWTADTLDDLNSINAIGGTEGPRRGDVAFVTSEASYYLWMDNHSWVIPGGTGGGGGGTGDVIGPPSSENETIVLFDGTTGKAIEDSGTTITELVAQAATAAEDAILPIDLVTDVSGVLPQIHLPPGIVMEPIEVADLPANVATKPVSLTTDVSGILPSGNLPTTVQYKPIAIGDLPSSVGDVIGPASSTDNAVALYDGTTGKLIKNSTVLATNIALKDVSNVFTADQEISKVSPNIIFRDTSQAADLKNFMLVTLPGCCASGLSATPWVSSARRCHWTAPVVYTISVTLLRARTSMRRRARQRWGTGRSFPIALRISSVAAQ